MTDCKDCKAENKINSRPATPPGPRCATHHRERKKQVRSSARARRLWDQHQMTTEQYQALYEAQGGVCYICGVATGKTKMLAVDHDHGCTAGHDPKKSCPKCWRGLLCGPCNFDLLGRYSPDALVRALAYLTNPPARRAS